MSKPPPSGRVPVAPCRLPAPQGSTKPRACPQSCLSSLAAELRRPFGHLLVAWPGPWPRGLPSQPPCRLLLAGPWEAAGFPRGASGFGSESSGQFTAIRRTSPSLKSKTNPRSKKESQRLQQTSLSVKCDSPILSVSQFCVLREEGLGYFFPRQHGCA